MEDTKEPSSALASVELQPALREHAPVLANLLELYAHDFSEFHPINLGEDGRFGYKHLPLYWSQPDRHPFLLRVNGNLAGLALIKRGSEISLDPLVWDMAEFFVLRKYRRHRIGTLAAHLVWRRIPGPWQLRVMQSNPAAFQFWQQAINSFAQKEILPVLVEHNDLWWHLFSFNSG